MSSSQGVNADTVTGYPFNKDVIRNASDWIKYKKQARVYQDYHSVISTEIERTEPAWIKYGNDMRLDYLHGQYTCDECLGDAFSGSIESTPLLRFYPANLMFAINGLVEEDDSIGEIVATGMDFYMDGTNYGDGQNGGIYLSSNNDLMFGNAFPNDCCPDAVGFWASSHPSTPAFILNAGDRYSFMAATSGVLTSGNYKYIVIYQSWQDLEAAPDVTCETQITLAKNTITGQQYLEYRVRKIDSTGANVFSYYLPNTGSEVQIRSTVPDANSSFLLTGNSDGTSWSYQDNVSLNLY